MSHITLINSTDLDLWADRLDARSQLPRLIRRLIHATASDIQRIGFPADEGVQLSGWDGIVQASSGNDFVPSNLSVWEMGVNGNPKQKADDDYEKRSQKPLGVTPSDTSFIFVTLRRWNGKKDWEQTRSNEGLWREVRAYDAEDLAQWLETATGVHLWLSELLGKHPQGVLSLDSFWEDWSCATNPPLYPDLVIGGREEASDRVLAWLRCCPSVLTLQGDSPEEVTAFLAAVIQDLQPEERVTVLSRAVVVDDVTSWRSLALSDATLILIARFNQPEGIGRVLQNGHHVFVPLGRAGATGAFPLPRIVRSAAEQSFKARGLSDARSRDLATLARRSLSALRRKLAIAPGVQVPAWAQPNEARTLLTPLLVGSWHDSSKGDRDALSHLAGIPYDQFQRIAVRWANESDPPLRRVGDVRMVAAREDTWLRIACYLTADDLKRFESVALSVLGETNPAFELPIEKRFAASIYGKVLPHSGHLREGIVETLALMATLSSDVEFAANTTGEKVAREIVWMLMERMKGNANLWASLSHQLPLLAEAAPSVFLDAVNTGLSGDVPTLVSMFQDRPEEGGALGISSPHTGLLWALETLAWNPDYLASAALSLARLARLDPGGRLANRPAHSLREIFICWYPNTTAPLHRRLAVLDAIRRREPDVAWQLLMRLLPEHHSTVSLTHGTRWRDWVPDSRAKSTVQDYVEATDTVVRNLLSDVRANASRWCNLIVSAGGLTTLQREELLRHLEELDPGLFSSDERVQVQNCLRKEVVRHRDFPDATWAMPAEHVHRLEKVYARFEPDDPIARHLWLFRHRVELPSMLRTPLEKRKEVLDGLRAEALEEVLNIQGWYGLLSLAQRVEEPEIVGLTLGYSNLLPVDLGSFLQGNFGTPESWCSQMAQSFVSACAHRYGEPWIEDYLLIFSGTWRPEQYGDFLLCLPFNSSTIERLDSIAEEVQRYYWSRIRHVGFPKGVDADRVVEYLLKFERPHAAIDPIAWALTQTPEIISSERIAEVLEVSVQTPPNWDFDASAFAYASAELLTYLEKTTISRDRFARLEWLYLRIHEHYRRPHILHAELARNPEFFIEVLQCVYRPKNELQLEESEKDIAFAQIALGLLDSWKQMPGVQENDVVDANVLQKWVMRVRELAAACDRSEIADMHIGYVFAFSPLDSDGAWPHQSVRELIEDLASPDIENGWRSQIFNNRGVTTRGLTDGGEQERALVEQYEGYAKQIGDLWPRTAAVLRDRAEIYRCGALWEDQQAELTQDFWR